MPRANALRLNGLRHPLSR